MNDLNLAESVDAFRVFDDISNADHIVIYCGAGVTQDRTGVTWNRLTAYISRRSRSKIAEICSLGSDEEIHALGEELKSFYANSQFSEENKASVSCAIIGNDQAHIVSAISSILYRDSGWQYGRLLETLIEFVGWMAFLGKKVTLVTTSYDTYLEDLLSSELDLLKKHSARTESPGLIVTTLTRSFGADEADDTEVKRTQIRLVEPLGSGSTIELIYLHGRVDRDGGLSGTLVFSEREYEESHERTTEELCRLFSYGPTLIVGSKLIDTPLVRGLLTAKRTNGSRYSRFSLMRRKITGSHYSQYFQRARATELGIRPLFYDHYADIPTLFSNLVSLEFINQFGYSEDLPHKRALSRWMSGLKFNKGVASDIYDLLERYAHGFFPLANSRELLKIECWFIDEEEGAPVLRIWANSGGPILNSKLRRTESIERGSSSKVAAVRAFSSGSPELVEINTLGYEDEKSGRWRTFLAVPTTTRFHSFELEAIVGVIVLASTSGFSTLKDVDFFDDELDSKMASNDSDSFLWTSTEEVKAECVRSLRAIGELIVDRITISRDNEADGSIF